LTITAFAFDDLIFNSTYVNVTVNNTVIKENVRPEIGIVSPENNTEVLGEISISGYAHDDLKINYVKIEIAGTIYTLNDTSGNDTWYSWDIRFNTTILQNGKYSLRAEASDGQYSAYDEIIIVVNNFVEPQKNLMPIVVIVWPTNMSTVSGIITISGRAWDPDGIVKNVQIKIASRDYNATDKSGNGTWYFWNLDFDTANLINGKYNVTAFAIDDLVWSKNQIEINIQNIIPDKCPFVEVQKSKTQNEVNGTIIISGRAWDDNSVQSVIIQIDTNEFNATDTSGNKTWYTWEYILNTSGFDDGTYLIAVIVTDGYCNDYIQFFIKINNSIIMNDTSTKDEEIIDDDEDEPNPPDSSISSSAPSSRFEISMYTVAIIVTLATIGIFGTAAFGIESSKYKLLSIFVVPLYSRRKKDQVLENFIRGEIYGFIQAHPGTYFNHIKITLNLNNGTLAYHLNVLEEDNMIYSRSDRHYKRFYPMEGRLPSVDNDDGNIHTFVYLNATQNKIIKIIQENPGLSQKEIARMLGKSNQVINYNISAMAELGLVKLEREGKITKCYSQDLYPIEDSM
jgi:uncharacterized membrane protein